MHGISPPLSAVMMPERTDTRSHYAFIPPSIPLFPAANASQERTDCRLFAAPVFPDRTVTDAIANPYPHAACRQSVHSPPSAPACIFIDPAPGRAVSLHDRRAAHNSPLSIISHLLCLSSNALALRGPHLARTSANASFILTRCSSDDVQHIMTKSLAQPNRVASAVTLFLTGSSARSRRISATSASLRWYRLPACGLTCGKAVGSTSAPGVVGVVGALYWIVADEENRLAGSWARRRGSDRGRNLKGVWYTEGAAEGGLKMMWLEGEGPAAAAVGAATAALLLGLGTPAGERKDGCGGMLSARLVREVDDLWRAASGGEGRSGRVEGEGRREEERRRRWQQLAAGRLVSWTSMVAVGGGRETVIGGAPWRRGGAPIAGEGD